MSRLSVLTFAITVLLSMNAAAASSGPVDRGLRLVLSKHLPHPAPVRRHTQSANKNVSELNLLATGLIKCYQVFVSSQDVEACNFHPSCSRFAAEAIGRYGALRGSLLGADRLMRCHWFSRRQGAGKCARGRDAGRICDHPGLYHSDD